MVLNFKSILRFLTIVSIISSITFVNRSVEQLFAFCGKTLIICFVSYLITILLRKYRTKQFVNSNGKAVLITGCDSGFGNRLAYKLNQNGFRVYATVLSAANEGSKQLVRSAVFEDKMHVLEMNVTNDDNVRQVYEEVKSDLNSNGDQLWAVVNNAGMITYGHIEWGTIDDYKQVFEVNTFGALRVTRIFAPLIKASQGRIVITASLAGRVTTDNLGAYCMSKHAVIAFSDALRREICKFGVKVITIEPGAFKTEMTSDQLYLKSLEKTWNQSEESVKKSYGNNYYEKCKELIKTVNLLSGSNLDIVVDDMTDAVQNTDPLSRYCPKGGLLMTLLLPILLYLPNDCTDFVSHLVNPFRPEDSQMSNI